MKCDGTCAETRFRLSAQRTSPFKSAGGGRQFSRLLAAEVCGISGSNAGYTMFRGSVKGTGYPLHSPVSPFTSPARASPCDVIFQLDNTSFPPYLNLHDLILFLKSLIPRFSYCGRQDFTATTKHMKLKSRTPTTHNNFF